MAKKVLDEMPKEDAKKEAEQALEAVEKEEKSARECKKCNAKKFILPAIIVAVVAVVGCLCFFGYRMIFGDNPVKVTTKAIRSLKSSIKDAKDDSDGMSELLEGEDPYEISSKINVTLPENMGKYTLNALIQADSKNEIAKVNIDAKQGKTYLLALNALFKNNKLYFNLPDTMKNYYFMDVTNIMKEFTNSVSKVQKDLDAETISLISKYDFTKLIDYTADAIDSVLTKDDFDKEKDEITINDKDYKATKYTAKIDQKKAIKIAKAFAKKAVKDEDLIKIIASVTGAKESEIKDIFNELIDTEPENTEEGYILYSVYVSSLGKTLGYGFELEGMGKVVIGNKGDNTTITVTVGEYSGSLNIEEKSDDHVVITGNFLGIITATVDVKSNFDTVKKNKEYKETLDVDVTLSAMGTNVKASLNAETVVKKISKVDDTEVKNAINVEKMTSSEASQFMREVEKSSLYKLFETFAKSQEVTNYSTSL